MIMPMYLISSSVLQIKVVSLIESDHEQKEILKNKVFIMRHDNTSPRLHYIIVLQYIDNRHLKVFHHYHHYQPPVVISTDITLEPLSMLLHRIDGLKITLIYSYGARRPSSDWIKVSKKVTEGIIRSEFQMLLTDKRLQGLFDCLLLLTVD